MRRMSSVLRLLAVLALAVLALAAPASAHIGGNPPPVHHDPPPPSGTSGNGTGSGAQHTTSGSCSLYSNSSTFGYACFGAGASGHVDTVKEILHGDPVPTCWDERLTPEQDTDYGVDENDGGGPYYLHQCLSGIDVDRPPTNQPGLKLNLQIVPIPGGQPCPDDPNKPYKDAYFETCVYTLSVRQQQVVSYLVSHGADIPPLIIKTNLARVRANQVVAFQNHGLQVDANGNPLPGQTPGELRTPDLTEGGVTLWAQIDTDEAAPGTILGGGAPAPTSAGYLMQPDGVGTTKISCDAELPVSATAKSGVPADACWFTYPVSSAGQPNQAYPFHAEAHWTVYYRDGQGTHVLGHYTKTFDVPQPVVDVQALVIH